MSFSDLVILAGFVFLVPGRLGIISISMVIIRPLVVVIILGSFRSGRLSVMVAVIIVVTIVPVIVVIVIVIPVVHRVPIIIIVHIWRWCRGGVHIWT